MCHLCYFTDSLDLSGSSSPYDSVSELPQEGGAMLCRNRKADGSCREAVKVMDGTWLLAWKRIGMCDSGAKHRLAGMG